MFPKKVFSKGIEFKLRKFQINSAEYSAKSKYGLITIFQERFLDEQTVYSGSHLGLGQLREQSFGKAVQKEISHLKFLQEEKKKDIKRRKDLHNKKKLINSAKNKLTKEEWRAVRK